MPNKTTPKPATKKKPAGKAKAAPPEVAKKPKADPHPDRVRAGAPGAPAVRRPPRLGDRIDRRAVDMGSFRRGTKDEGDGLPAFTAAVEGLTYFGRGVVALHPDGRAHGRYGLVGLRGFTPDRLAASGWDVRRDVLADAEAGPVVSLVVVVEAARKSHHVGDWRRDLYPVQPDRGERVVFGPGLVVTAPARQVDEVAGGIWFGLDTPYPVRAPAADPAALYRLVDQTVAAYLQPVREPVKVARLRETLVESHAIRNQRAGRAGAMVYGLALTTPDGRDLGAMNHNAAFDLCRENGWDWAIKKTDGTTTKPKRRGAYV